MPLNHDKATATVSVEGLAIGCLNEKTRNWEVALLREPKHVLTISVTTQWPGQEPTFSEFTIDTNHSIFIDAVDAVEPANQLHMEGRNFDRKKPEAADAEDLRWIVDFDREFNGGKPVEVTKPKFPVTELTVAQPVLYADDRKKRSEMNLVNLEKHNEDEFGTFAEIAKADITCKEGGEVVLRVEGPEGFSVRLPHIPGAPHTIAIENLCPPALAAADIAAEVRPGRQGGFSDFSLYFTMIKAAKGNKFDLRRKKPNPGDVGPLGADAVCNSTFLGSTPSLFPVG